MEETVKSDMEIFQKLDQVYSGGRNQKIEIVTMDSKKKSGNIGDDFILFDFSDEETSAATEKDSDGDNPELGDEATEAHGKRKGTESINGERPVNKKNSKMAAPEAALSAEAKKKLGKLFHQSPLVPSSFAFWWSS